MRWTKAERTLKRLAPLAALMAAAAAFPPVGEASLSGKKIGLDPGHGAGENPGVVIAEGTWVLDAAFRARTYLENDGANVVMTRTSGADPTISTRVNILNSNNVHRAVSLHSNGASAAANGMEAYYCSLNPSPGTSHTLATQLRQRALSMVHNNNRGTKECLDAGRGFHFGIIRQTNMPSSLPEYYFHTNSWENQNIHNTASGREDVGKSLYAAICDHYGVTPDFGGPNLAGHMELFARSGNTLFHKRRLAGEGWTSWTSLGGSVAGNPGVASWAEGRVNIYMRGTNGNIHRRRYVDGAWGPWGELPPPPGGFQGSVSVASRKYEHYITVVRGNDNAIWKRSYLGYSGQGWNNWSRIDATAGEVASSPSVVSRAEDRISIFYRDTNNELKRVRWDEANPSVWIGPTNHGGNLVNNPSAVSADPGHIFVYSLAWDGNLWRRGLIIGDGWTDWEPVGTGGIVSGPAATNLGGANRHDVAFRAPDNSIKLVYRLNGTWNGPVDHGGSFLGGPGAVTWNK